MNYYELYHSKTKNYLEKTSALQIPWHLPVYFGSRSRIKLPAQATNQQQQQEQQPTTINLGGSYVIYPLPQITRIPSPNEALQAYSETAAFNPQVITLWNYLPKLWSIYRWRSEIIPRPVHIIPPNYRRVWRIPLDPQGTSYYESETAHHPLDI
jgi:hypothetical protein